MEKQVKKRRISLGSIVFTLLSFGVAVGIFAFGIGRAGRGADEQWLQSTRDAISRAAISCYAIEGIYPPDIQYLRDHYGLIVDESKYKVHYNVFASNIMPDIDVIPLG